MTPIYEMLDSNRNRIMPGDTIQYYSSRYGIRIAKVLELRTKENSKGYFKCIKVFSTSITNKGSGKYQYHPKYIALIRLPSNTTLIPKD